MAWGSPNSKAASGEAVLFAFGAAGLGGDAGTWLGFGGLGGVGGVPLKWVVAFRGVLQRQHFFLFFFGGVPQLSFAHCVNWTQMSWKGVVNFMGRFHRGPQSS